MSDKPLVTVMIPSYNHAHYIIDTIKSIFTQTYQNFELIVINDGSPDNSLEVLETLQKEYSFTLVDRENKGLIATLNEGLSYAKGEFFCAIASDDIMLPNRLEDQVNYMQKYPEFAMCFSKMMTIDDNNEVLGYTKNKHIEVGNVFYQLYKTNFINAASVMHRTKVLRSIGGYSDKYKFEDYPLWLSIAQKHKIGFVDEYHVQYRHHDANMSKQRLMIIREEEKILIDFNIDDKTDVLLKKRYARWFSKLLKINELEGAKDYMEKALSQSWYQPKFWRDYLKYIFKSFKV